MNNLDDLTIAKIVNESDQELERRLKNITGSHGLLDFVFDMANLWHVDSFPISGIDSFSGDQGKYYIFKNIVRFCKLELARRRILPLVNNEKDYLLGIIAVNKILGRSDDIKITGSMVNNASTKDRRESDRDFNFISAVSGHDNKELKEVEPYSYPEHLRQNSMRNYHH